MTLRVLMLHNRYATPGGEDVSTHTEVEMLRERGHEVYLWEVSNEGIDEGGLLSTAANAVWSRAVARELSALLRATRYDVMHVQNFFPRFSPVVHRVARHHGVPSIQHLRNFRYTCVNATLFREGATCHDCLGAFVPWLGVRRGCYRNSRAGSAVVAAMIGAHKLVGTWTGHVACYIAISNYVKDIHVRAGLPASKIVVRPNIVRTVTEPFEGLRQNVFVAARLVPEKGVQTVITAWKRIVPGSHTLRIAGSGPMELELRAMAGDDPSIVFLGQIAPHEIIREMARARAVVVPSLWAEPFGRTALEAMSVGTPVLVSNTGGLPEVVGLDSPGLYNAGDANSLATRFGQIIFRDGGWAMIKKHQLKKFRADFSIDEMAARTERVYVESAAGNL